MAISTPPVKQEPGLTPTHVDPDNVASTKCWARHETDCEAGYCFCNCERCCHMKYGPEIGALMTGYSQAPRPERERHEQPSRYEYERTTPYDPQAQEPSEADMNDYSWANERTETGP